MDDKTILIFDIEADNLYSDVTKIHCISIQEFKSGTTVNYSGDDLDIALGRLTDADVLVGHNICGFDIPAIKKLYPTWENKGDLYDTLLMGCIMLPEEGIMSLDKWAKKLRLKQQKVEHEDWSVYTKEMGERCIADVKINASVFEYLQSLEAHDKALPGLALEQKVALIHTLQSDRGVRFDVLKAIELLKELDTEIAVLHESLVKDAPWRCIIPGVSGVRQQDYREEMKSLRSGMSYEQLLACGTAARRKDGTVTIATQNYFGSYTQKVKGPYSKVSFKGLNPDSDAEIKKLLLDLGWKPTEWNGRRDKGTGEYRITSPKLTEDSFSSLPDGLGADVARYKMLTHRRRFLLNKDKTKGALRNVNTRTGRVRSDAFTCGTPTSRYRHQGTVCNIPRPSTPYGKEIRSLFTVPTGAWMVGIDLSGIEARMLAHYLLRGDYPRARETADLILSPDKKNDFHTYNAKAWGVSRDIAKNGLYA